MCLHIYIYVDARVWMNWIGWERVHEWMVAWWWWSDDGSLYTVWQNKINVQMYEGSFVSQWLQKIIYKAKKDLMMIVKSFFPINFIERKRNISSDVLKNTEIFVDDFIRYHGDCSGPYCLLLTIHNGRNWFFFTLVLDSIQRTSDIIFRLKDLK